MRDLLRRWLGVADPEVSGEHVARLHLRIQAVETELVALRKALRRASDQAVTDAEFRRIVERMLGEAP